MERQVAATTAYWLLMKTGWSFEWNFYWNTAQLSFLLLLFEFFHTYTTWHSLPLWCVNVCSWLYCTSSCGFLPCACVCVGLQPTFALFGAYGPYVRGQEKLHYKGLILSVVHSFSRKFSWNFPQWGRENGVLFGTQLFFKKRLKTFYQSYCVFSVVCIFV